jgi:SAM-dependent methyltransferase
VHTEAAKTFFSYVIGTELMNFPRGNRLHCLDAGCGPGAWSEYLLDIFAERGITGRLVAFDISDGMIDVARERLAGRVNGADLAVGDLLNPGSYLHPEIDGFDVVIAYDAIQQLPVKRQRESISLITDSLAVGGKAIIFDHDCNSIYGRRMAWRKFLTKYFFVPLIPRYYCNAKYPPLARISAEYDDKLGLSTRILAMDDFPKQALVIERTA